jgi:hypothetical protein
MARHDITHEMDEDVRAVAREDMSLLLDELRARPELNELDDEQSMALAVSETRTVRRERGAKGRVAPRSD